MHDSLVKDLMILTTGKKQRTQAWIEIVVNKKEFELTKKQYDKFSTIVDIIEEKDNKYICTVK